MTRKTRATEWKAVQTAIKRKVEAMDTAAAPADDELPSAPPGFVLSDAGPLPISSLSADDMRKAIADLYHADGKGLSWLAGTVLGNGTYRCLSEVPKAHMRAVLMAG